MKASTGSDLFAIVEKYAAMGVHRAGTDVDARTAEWVALELRERGLTVDARPVPFRRWVHTSRLLADGSEVEHLPVYHEWEGSLGTDNLYVAAFDPRRGGFPGALAEPAARARAAGADAAVLATTHPEGSLVAVNRIMDAGSGFPVVLVAGRDLERFATGPRHLDLDAHLEPASTTNLVATNDLDGPPLLLTTPLTGWFTCAGERATGLAVFLHLVERFADRPLLVVATGGHELGYFGVRRWVDEIEEHGDARPAAIIHVGASVAVDEPRTAGTRELIDTRLATTDVDGATAEAMATALSGIGLDLVTGSTGWLGESEVFCDLAVPMLSLTGSGIDFHTPDDTPERATSPGSLARVAAAVGDAVAALDHGVRSAR